MVSSIDNLRGRLASLEMRPKISIRAGSLANRPTTSLSNGDRYFAIDTGTEYYYNGTAWGLLVGPAPAGAAGGDLKNTYPNPAVAQITGATTGVFTNAAASGVALSATNSNASNTSNAVSGNTVGSGYGVYGTSTTGSGVKGDINNNQSAVWGLQAGTGQGVYGQATAGGNGVYGGSSSGNGVFGTATTGPGVQGNVSNNSPAVVGNNYGAGIGVNGYSGSGWAGYFNGPAGYGNTYTQGVARVDGHIGTAWPTAIYNGQIFYHSTLHAWAVWDTTYNKWIEMVATQVPLQLFALNTTNQVTQLTTAGGLLQSHRSNALRYGTAGIVIDAYSVSYQVATTHNASNYYAFNLKKYDSASGTTVPGQFYTYNLSEGRTGPGTNYTGEGTINTLYTQANAQVFDIDIYQQLGTPGTLYVFGASLWVRRAWN